MRNRILPALAVTAASALLLTGCIGGGTPDSAPPAVTVDEVAVPATLRPAQASAEVSYGMVGASDDLPWLLGGALAEPGKPATPTVWSSDDGSSWTAKSVGDEDGSFSGDIDGSETLAALGGTLWKDGSYTNALWTSSDGEAWARVDVPDDGYLLGNIAVTGDVVYAIATNVDGASRGIRVDGDDAATFDLPDVADDELLGAQSISADGDTLVLVARPGPEGDPSDTVSFTSDDGGKSWADAVTIIDQLGFVAGVAPTGDGFVATGGAPRGDGATSPAAWFTTDGATWAAESVPGQPEDGPIFTFAGADTWLSTPLSRGGVTSAILGNDNSAFSGVYSRQPGGAWSFVAQTSVNSTSGQTGVAMPGDGGSIVAAMIGSGYARTGTVAGGWTDGTILSAREDVEAPADIYADDSDGATITLTKSTFTVDADLGWNNRTITTVGELSGDSFTEVAWDPEAVGTWSGVRLVTDDDGAQIVVGSYFDIPNSIIPAQGFFRASEDAAWAPVSGFEPGGATFFAGAAKVGDTWVAYGTTRASSGVSDPEHGVVWTSTDGATWTRGAGDFGSGVLETSVAGVCALPDGTSIAVGWVEETEGEFRTAVWSSASGTWTRVDIGELGSRYGFGTSCASDKDGVVLGATVGGRNTLQQSEDGSSWTEVFKADRGISIGEPVAVDGGFVASGSVDSEDYTGPVVWLSKSGTEWSPVSIASYRTGSTTGVEPLGDDLIVTMSGRIGSPVSIIRDIATVIADKG